MNWIRLLHDVFGKNIRPCAANTAGKSERYKDRSTTANMRKPIERIKKLLISDIDSKTKTEKGDYFYKDFGKKNQICQ